MALRAVLDHPKFADLKARIGRSRYVALGCLEAVWHFTGRFTPQGNIGKYSDTAIEAWVEWDGAPGALVEAMVQSGWLERTKEHRVIVHDWHEHADDATRLSLKRKKLGFVTLITSMSGQCRDSVATTSGLPEPEPVPEPEPEPGAVPEPPQAAEAPPLPAETPRTPVIPISQRDPDEGGELPLAHWLLEESGVPADTALLRIAAECIRLWAKENAVTLQQAAEWIAQQAAEARCRGETVNRFWFSDQRYRPVVAGQTRKQLEKKARIEAFRKAGGDEGARA